MTETEAQLDNPNVIVAIAMKQKYHLTFDQMYALAWYLSKQTVKHDEHRKMLAAKWCKNPPVHKPRPVETMAEAAAKVDAVIAHFLERQVSLGPQVEEILERRRSDLYE